MSPCLELAADLCEKVCSEHVIVKSSLASAMGSAIIPARAVLCIMLALVCSTSWTSTFAGTAGRHPRNTGSLVRRAADRSWGKLTPEDRRKPAGGAEYLGEFLYEMAQLTPCRYFVNGLAIMEANADLRGGRAVISIGHSPKGKPVLVLRAQDGTFQLKLDAEAIVAIELEEAEQTGAHIIRFLDSQRRRHLSAVMLGDDAEARFQIMMGRWTSRVDLRR